MSSTKIINVSRDDTFEEIFNLFASAPADEVIFVLPKTAKAFSKDVHFSRVAKAAEDAGKRVSVMTANAAVVAMARAYRFDIIANAAAAPKKRAAAEPIANLAAQADDYNFMDHADEDVVMPSDESMGAEEPGDDDEDEVSHAMRIEDDDDIQEPGGEVDTEEELVEVPSDESSPEEVAEVDEETQEAAEDEPSDEELAEEETFADEEDALAEDVVATGGGEVISPAQFAVARSMDGMVRASSGKHVNVRGGSDRAERIPVEKDTQLEELEQVWQGQDSPRPKETLWSEVRREERRERHWPSFRGLFGFLGARKHSTDDDVPSAHRHWTWRRIFTWVGVVAVLIIVGMVAYPRSAQVTIRPIAKSTEFTATAYASDQVSSVDATFMKIPGQKFEVQRTAQQTFTPTGQKDAVQKAQGTITVYNNYAASSQVLIATTRFENESGLVFRTLRTITVPGKTSSGPGSVDVAVIADQPGAAYNLPAGTHFTVSAWREQGDTARVEGIYGESAEGTHGGIQGQSPVVTQSDYDAAVDTVKKQLRAEMLDEIRSQARDLTIPDAVDIAIDVVKSTAGVDDAATSYTVSAEGTATVVGYREADLDKLIAAYIDTKYNLQAVTDKLKITVTKSSFSDITGAQEMTVAVSGNSYEKVDVDKLRKDLAGKKDQEFRDYLNGVSSIETARVKLVPFWTSRIPTDQARISVDLTYE